MRLLTEGTTMKKGIKKKVVFSYENSKRLMDRSADVHRRINDIVYRGIRETNEKAISDLNKMVYELAEKQKCSVWDICFNCVPDYDYPSVDFAELKDAKDPYRYTATVEMRLIPLELNFEKGGGYWKDKYYRLKEKLQEIIDNKND